MISYEDVGSAIDWLGTAFGFEESGERYSDDEGRVTHAELSLDGATVFLGWPGPEYRSPKRHAQECEQAARWLASPWVIDGVNVEVADVNAHFERAQAVRRGDPARARGSTVRAALLGGGPRRPPLDVHTAELGAAPREPAPNVGIAAWTLIGSSSGCR